MFKHIYFNNIKIFIREKALIFWLLVFPMLLAIMFKAAFSNLMEGESFEKIAVSVVLNEESPVNAVYKTVFAELDDMLLVSYDSYDEACGKLEEGKVEACICADEEQKLTLLVNGNKINQSIVKEIVSKINEGVSLAQSGKQYSPDVENVVKNIELSGQSQDFTVTWFYTILGMAATYSMMLGVEVIRRIQANQSATAMRHNLTPVSKMKEFTSIFMAAATIESIIMVIEYFYLKYVMNIDFGERQGLIILVSVVGGICGVSIGTLVGIIVKKDMEFKIGICIGVAMIGSFLAGMMDNTMKYTVMQKMPIVEYINPAGLITDSYLKLYYYEDLSYFFSNIINLLVITVICMLGTVFILRRQKYDSI